MLVLSFYLSVERKRLSRATMDGKPTPSNASHTRGGNTTPRRRLPAFVEIVVEFNKAIVLLLLQPGGRLILARRDRQNQGAPLVAGRPSAPLILLPSRGCGATLNMRSLAHQHKDPALLAPNESKAMNFLPSSHSVWAVSSDSPVVILGYMNTRSHLGNMNTRASPEACQDQQPSSSSLRTAPPRSTRTWPKTGSRIQVCRPASGH